MPGKLSDWISRLSTDRATLAALLIFVLFTALVLPGQASPAGSAAEEVGSPDLSFAYSAGELYRMAEAYGPKGREDYVVARLTFDIVWPLIYTVFLCSAISWLNRRAYPADSRWQRGNLAPVLAALLDLLENLSTSLVMIRYPQRSDLAASLAPVFTTGKWLLVSGSFLLLLIGAGGLIWRWAKGRRRA